MNWLWQFDRRVSSRLWKRQRNFILLRSFNNFENIFIITPVFYVKINKSVDFHPHFEPWNARKAVAILIERCWAYANVEKVILTQLMLDETV